MTRLVRIDTKDLVYHVYEGKVHKNTIKSETPLDPEWVEYLRVHTDYALADLDNPDPEAA